MDHLSINKRLEIGKGWEERVRDDLNLNYKYNLKESTFHEDCREKTDCWYISKSGEPLRSAIKVRLNRDGLLEQKKTDILVALFDPFYGLNHPNTKKGRDMIYEYFLYISVVFKQHRVIDGKRIHEICNGMLQEGLEYIEELKPESRGYKSKLIFKPLSPDDPRKRQPDIGLAKSNLGWEPKVKMDDGLRETISYFRNLFKV